MARIRSKREVRQGHGFESGLLRNPLSLSMILGLFVDSQAFCNGY